MSDTQSIQPNPDIIAYLLDGHTIGQTAHKFGINMMAAHAIAQRIADGVLTTFAKDEPTMSRNLTNAQQVQARERTADIIEDLLSGQESTVSLGKKYGVSNGLIRNIAIENGVVWQPTPGVNPQSNKGRWVRKDDPQRVLEVQYVQNPVLDAPPCVDTTDETDQAREFAMLMNKANEVISSLRQDVADKTAQIDKQCNVVERLTKENAELRIDADRWREQRREELAMKKRESDNLFRQAADGLRATLGKS